MMVRRRGTTFIICTLLAMWSSVVSSQTTQLDSLEVLLSNHQAEDTVKVNLYNRIAMYIYKSDSAKAMQYTFHAFDIARREKMVQQQVDSYCNLGRFVSYYQSDSIALQYFQRALSIAIEIGYNEGILRCLTMHGIIHSQMGDNDSAMDFYQRALDLAEKVGDKASMLRTIGNMSVIYSNGGDYPKAIEHYQRMLILNKELGDKRINGSVYNNLGIIYKYMGIYPQAVDYFFQSLKEKQEIGDKEGIINSLINIGTVYTAQKDYNKAVKYIEEALKHAVESIDQRQVGLCYENLGDVMIHKGDGRAPRYLQQSLDIARRLSNINPQITTLIKLGDYFFVIKEYDNTLLHYRKALELINKSGRSRFNSEVFRKMGALWLDCNVVDSAMTYSLKSLQLANELHLLSEQVDVHLQLARIFRQMGDFEKAYFHMVNYVHYDDSMYDQNIARQAAEIEYAFRFEKEKQMLELEQQRSNAMRNASEKYKQVVIIILVIGIFMVSLLSIYLFKAYRSKMSANSSLLAQKADVERLNVRLNDLNATKDKFFSIISHDLKGAFNSILGFSDLMVSKEVVKSQDDMEEFAKTIHASAQNAHRMLQNLLEWSKSESGVMRYAPRHILLKHFINEFSCDGNSHASVKEVGFHVLVEDDCIVYADQDMLAVIIRNIVANAIKFTPRGGSVTISSRSMEEGTEICVTDTGIGMSETMIGKLFKISEKVSRLGTENEQGTGVGLLLVHELMQKHSGTINVVSSTGEGSKFCLFFPAENIK